MVRSRRKKIHPIIIYPYAQPRGTKDLLALFDWIEKTSKESDRYAKPITVVNRQTFYRNRKTCNKNFLKAYERIKEQSHIVDAWSVDTCQMWLAGFGHAYDNRSSPSDDVYWLIPGDFNYASPSGTKVLKHYCDIPNEVYSGSGADLCLGQIDVPADSSKHLIDTYATYGLLYVWFPAEAVGLRNLEISKPRSEFFAISHKFLEFAMVDKKWFPYEETVILLLLAMKGKKPGRKIETVPLGNIEDIPARRDYLANAMQQVERTERVLKLFWREREIHRDNADWTGQFRELDRQSEQIRNAALTILKNNLRRDTEAD